MLNRRRSQSTTLEVSWRAATKRAHPQHPFGISPALSSPQKWDVDVWRRGKRARRDISHSFDIQPVGQLPVPSSPSSRSAPPTPVFAATSTEFQFFPKSVPSLTSLASNPGEDDHRVEPDLNQLRSDAFGELRRSVAENGEGLVRRMRDYEDSRSRSNVYAKAKEDRRRGRKRKSLSVRHSQLLARATGSDGEDDVQIFAGEQPVNQSIPGPLMQRTLSLVSVDMGSDISGLEESERCSSPGATCDSVHSTFPSDDEDNQPAMTPSPYTSTMHKSSFTPALSHTCSNSANSSLVSLPLPSPVSPPHPSSDIYSSRLQLTTSHRLSLSASRSEKAIAALTLAMANGAGGLNDYDALRAIQLPSVLEDCQVGELWH